MSARAPDAIQHLWRDIDDLIPRAKLGGIVGDTAHSFGYHLARRDLPGSDYSVKLSKDRKGASDCASALDVTLPDDLMSKCTRRLLNAAKAEDPRLRALREFCGTLNGSQTYPWDLSSNSSEGVGSWDDSHLWHIHLSFYREYADDYTALAPIADVLAGKTRATTSTPAKPATPSPKPLEVSDMAKLVYVDKDECKKRKLTWPGWFITNGLETEHVQTPARLAALRALGLTVQKISIATYRGLGGK